MGRLAKPGDPYVTERGRIELEDKDPESSTREMSIVVPVARRMKISSQRNMNEMPSTDPGTQTAINAIMVYYLLGLTHNEIAHMIRIDVVTVQNIIESSDFQATFEMVFNELISINSTSLQATIGKYAHTAIDKLTGLMTHAKSEMVQFKAAQDIADRAGLDPEALFGKNASQEDQGFKVTILEEDSSKRTEVEINIKGRR